MIWFVLTLTFCAVAVVLCVLYLMETLYTAKLAGRWNWRRTEELILGFSAMSIFLMIIWAILDLA